MSTVSLFFCSTDLLEIPRQRIQMSCTLFLVSIILPSRRTAHCDVSVESGVRKRTELMLSFSHLRYIWRGTVFWVRRSSKESYSAEWLGTHKINVSVEGLAAVKAEFSNTIFSANWPKREMAGIIVSFVSASSSSLSHRSRISKGIHIGTNERDLLSEVSPLRGREVYLLDLLLEQ